MKNQKAIESAIKTLITEGRKSYVEDYNPSPAECIGQALASGLDHGFLEIAATALEDLNSHVEAAILRAMDRGKFIYHEESKIVTIDLEKP